MTMPPTTSPAPRRPQAEHSEAMREKPIDATLDCLVTEGDVGLTIGKIVERAEVSRGAPPHHFSTKAALIEAAAGEVVRRVSRKLALAFERSQDAPDPLEAFALAAWRDISTAQEGVRLSELTCASRREPELGATLRRLWTRMYRVMSRVAVRYGHSLAPSIPPGRVIFLTQWLMRGLAQDVPLGAPPNCSRRTCGCGGGCWSAPSRTDTTSGRTGRHSL